MLTVFLKQENSLDGIIKKIKDVGSICRIGDDEDGDYTQWLIEKGYTSVLRHGNVYLQIPCQHINDGTANIDMFIDKKVDCQLTIEGDYVYLSTDYLSIVENDVVDLMDYMCEPCYYHRKRYTFVIGADILKISSIVQSCNMPNNFNIGGNSAVVITGTQQQWMRFLPRLDSILDDKGSSDFIDQTIEKEG